MLGPKQNGSMGITALAALASLSLGFLYISQASRTQKNALTKAAFDSSQEHGQAANLSDLGILKSLVHTSLVGPATYEPALFPSNYFAKTWSLRKNNLREPKKVDINGNAITIDSLKSEMLAPQDAAGIFMGSTTQLGALQTRQPLEIVALNPDPARPFYIRSIDVRVRKAVSIPGSNQSKIVESIGRVPLEAPQPRGLKILVKAPGSASFTEFFGSESAPLPSGNYQFRVLASGVVHHAEITLNGNRQILGLKGTSINHEANNIRAVDIPIGDSQVISLGSKTAAQQVVEMSGCSFSVKNSVASAGALEGIDVQAAVFGVDGPSSSLGTVKRLFIQPEIETADAGGWACTDKCPTSIEKEVYANDEAFQRYLDISARGPADKRLVDYMELAKSAEVHAMNGVGAICTNFELLAQGIQKETGMNPSQAAKNKKDLYEDSKTRYMALKREFAYMAPSCVRQLIGARTDCGCFSAETLLRLADGRDRRAADIRVGDRLWNPRLQQGQRVKKVIAGPERWPLLRVTVDGISVDVTREHPFLTSDGLKPAHRLTKDDHLRDGEVSRRIEAIVPLFRMPGSADPEVWNFELEGSENPDEHYVLANGVMTGDLYLQIELQKQERGLVQDQSGERTWFPRN